MLRDTAGDEQRERQTAVTRFTVAMRCPHRLQQLGLDGCCTATARSSGNDTGPQVLVRSLLRVVHRSLLVAPLLTLSRPLLPYGYSHKTSCARPGYAVICNFWHPGNLTLRAERQSALMSKINPVWHRMLYSSCTHMATMGVKGLTVYLIQRTIMTRSSTIADKPRDPLWKCHVGVPMGNPWFSMV